MDFLTQARTYTGTTGRFYRTNDSPYTGVESIFNHRNYWVNVQDGSDDKATTNDTGFDLSNTDNWEYVFIDTIGRGKKKDTEEKEEENEGDEMFGMNDDTTSPRAGSQNGSPRADEGKAGEKENLDDVEEREQILDMPPSWVGKLSIARERVALRYGNTGCRTVLYERAKMEVFAPGANEMGLLSRLTVFKDLSRTIPLEVREEFSSRKDKLYRRVRFPLKGSMHEHFKPGRKTGLKLLIDQPGRSLELYFYLTARLDGKTKRIEKIGKKVTEYFEERDDNLSFRSILLDRSNGSQNRDGKRGTYTMPCGQLGDLLVTRMKQKFNRNFDVDADDDVADRTFYVEDPAEQRCVCVYHYGENNIRCSTREYFKDENRAPSEAFAAKFDPSAREEEVEAIWLEEKALHQEFKDAERQSRDIVALRKQEEGRVILDRSVFETARERAKAEASKVEEEEEVEEVRDERYVEYLTPFLQNCKDPKDPTQEEAAKARASCLAALKERLLERANIIQRRLDEENSALSKKQANFQRSRDHMEGADEAFEKFCSEAMFRISILEQRLSRHEESALSKYAALDQKLRGDPRLEILTGNVGR